MNIGFIGVGLMGYGMAVNLQRAGHGLILVAGRARQNTDRLVADGAVRVDAPETLAARSDALFLCLPNADSVTETMAVVADRLRPGTLIVDATTSLPEVTRRLAADLAERDIAFVDAPITGSPQAAQDGTLTSMVGAEQAAFDRARDLIDTYSSTVIRFGPPGSGHTAKLINNFITMGQVALITEAVRRCDRSGIDRDQIYEVLSTGGADSSTLRKMLPAALAGTYDGHRFSLENAAKDVAYARRMIDELGEDSTMIAAMQAFFERELRDRPGASLLGELLKD